MGKINIIGNQNPEIGIPHEYSIFKAFEMSPIQSPVFGASQEMAHWEIFVLERNSWRKTEGNAKIGEQVSYTFNQKSLTRKGIKIIVTKGNDKAELTVRTKPAKKPKINTIDLLDINGHKVTAPLSYADTLIAKAYCTDMEGESLHFTLWEDDAKREGHNKINEVNKINPIPQRATVKKGIAQARFNMAQYTMASRIANMQIAKGDKNEGKTHEYYVTAEYYGKLEASNNVNLKNPDYNAHQNTEQKKIQVANQHKNTSVKPTLPVKQPNKKPEPPKPAPKKETPKYPIGKSKTKVPDTSGQIVSVEIKDKNRNTVTQNPKYGEGIFVHIKTNNVLNKKYKLTIWEDDTFGKHDLLYTNIHVIKDNEQWVYVSLTKEMQQTGEIGNDRNNPDSGEYSMEFTAHQELFVEIEFADISMKSSTVNVDANAKYKVPETSRSVAVVKGEKNGGNIKNCVCKDSYADLIWGGKVSCEFRRKVVEISRRQNIDPNNFMAAMAHETAGTFDPTCGTFKKHKDESRQGYVGLLQIGKDAAKDMGITRTELLKLNAEKQLDWMEKYLTLPIVRGKLKTLTDFYLAVLFPVDCGKGNQPNHIVFDNSLPITYNSKGHPIENLNYWRNVSYQANPAFHKEGKNEQGKTFVWEITDNIKKWYELGKSNEVNILICQNKDSKNNIINAKDIATYHTYADGRIEKHIPKIIKEEYKNKYKYIYHDSKGIEHVICTAEWHTTKEKGIGQVHNTKPTHSKVISDQNVSEGNTSRRVIYENGDIAEYGSHPKKGIIWLLYKAGKNNVELIKMPDSLDYKKENINIAYIFTTTQRRYTGAGAFAGFIGYLAKSGHKLKTTGSCFSGGSSFPSQEHCNGRSVDTLYLGSVEQDQKVIDSAMFFHFTEVLKGVNDYCQKLKRAGNGGSLHNSHLHSGNFESSVIKIIKEL